MAPMADDFGVAKAPKVVGALGVAGAKGLGLGKGVGTPMRTSENLSSAGLWSRKSAVVIVAVVPLAAASPPSRGVFNGVLEILVTVGVFGTAGIVTLTLSSGPGVLGSGCGVIVFNPDMENLTGVGMTVALAAEAEAEAEKGAVTMQMGAAAGVTR